MAYLVGIDSGMANVKAAVFDGERGLVAETAVECPAAFRDGDRFEVDMHRYWDAVVQCMHRISSRDRIDLREVRGIAVSSQGVTFVPVDGRGDVLGRAIFSYDTRARAESRELVEVFGEDSLYRVTGQPAVDATLEAPKLLWMRKHESERFRAADRILLVHDYLLFRLAGEHATVRSIQSSSLLLDIRRRSWWPEMLDAIGLGERQLPPLVKHGEPIGTISREAAEATGLPRDTVVVAGAIDQVCGMIGVCNTEEGIISESTGSVLAIHTVSGEPFPRRDAGVYTFCGADERTYALIPVCPTAGSALAWFARAFCGEGTLGGVGLNTGAYDRLTAEAAAVAPGADGLVMLPYLAGSGSPKPDPNARGAICGLTLSHGRGHVTRALLEGVACLLRSNLDTFRSAGRHAAEIRSFGGGSRSPLWNQIKADLCGLPVTTSTISEPGCLGAAILAGVGSRVFATIEEGCRRFVRFREPLRPDPACAAVYERLYERFLRLGRALESLEGNC